MPHFWLQDKCLRHGHDAVSLYCTFFLWCARNFIVSLGFGTPPPPRVTTREGACEREKSHIDQSSPSSSSVRVSRSIRLPPPRQGFLGKPQGTRRSLPTSRLFHFLYCTFFTPINHNHGTATGTNRTVHFGEESWYRCLW